MMLLIALSVTIGLGILAARGHSADTRDVRYTYRVG